jgi:glycosyltransferase involved in cell wall biosynthesis
MYFQLKRKLNTRAERKLSNKIVMVVPCFNEAKRLDLSYFNTLSEIKSTMWIFVDDGSTDGTSKMLENFSKKENIIHVTINDNVGKSNAVAYGMNYAAKNISNIGWLGFLDSDGAFATGDVESVIKMTSQIKEYDALYTSRVKMAGRNIKRNNVRHFIARIITSIFGLVWKDIPYDTQSGFKLYRYYDNFNLMFINPFKTRWFLDIELSIRFLHHKGKNIKVWEEPVSSWFDIPGSKIDYRQSARIILEAMYIFYLLLCQRKKSLNN